MKVDSGACIVRQLGDSRPWLVDSLGQMVCCAEGAKIPVYPGLHYALIMSDEPFEGCHEGTYEEADGVSAVTTAMADGLGGPAVIYWVVEEVES